MPIIRKVTFVFEVVYGLYIHQIVSHESRKISCCKETVRNASIILVRSENAC